MRDILRDFSVPALVQAMEDNMRELAIRWGQLIGARFYEDDECSWFISGVPFELGNGVIRSRFNPGGGDAAVDRRIEQLMAYDVPMAWLINPSTLPRDIGQRLLAHGWIFDGEAPGMALDLLTLDDTILEPRGLRIIEVSDDETLDQWVRAVVIGSQMPESVLEFASQLHSQRRFTPVPTVRCYLGLLDGEPVASSLVFLDGGVAGIYDVATLPQARGRGFGTALTIAPLLDARKTGYRFAILQSSPMGLNLYRRLGFQSYCSFAMYFWPGSKT